MVEILAAQSARGLDLSPPRLCSPVLFPLQHGGSALPSPVRLKLWRIWRTCGQAGLDTGCSTVARGWGSLLLPAKFEATFGWSPFSYALVWVLRETSNTLTDATQTLNFHSFLLPNPRGCSRSRKETSEYLRAGKAPPVSQVGTRP